MNFANPSPVHAGSNSIKVDSDGYQALYSGRRGVRVTDDGNGLTETVKACALPAMSAALAGRQFLRLRVTEP